MDRRPILARMVIPAGLEFSALRLRRERSGEVSYDRAVLRRVLDASGISEAVERAVMDPDDFAAGVLTGWYRVHLSRGGAADATMEQLIAEAEQEARNDAN